MKLSKHNAKENLTKLIEKFEKENLAGRINDYNEEATKTGFIQPFLKNVLGWNVSDRDEVSPEERISRGRVDYGLKIQGQNKLFIEVKPPRADLDKHIKQAVGYGYNRKSVPFVLLTDFEGIKLFDVTIKPDVRNPLKGLKIDLNWKEYLLKFDKIWLLSKESVLNGELDKLLLKKPKDRLPVDKAILDDLKQWREKLAKDIFKNNPNLFHSPPPFLPPQMGEEKACPACPERTRGELVSVGRGADYLKEITQRIIDRIMFMRSCEDRKLVHRRSLKDLFEERTETVGTNTMVFLGEEFKHYNIIFDSDLFRPQDWEINLAINFKVMKDIILDTYNPYQFDVIPLEVLGNMYEQYLGYTIRLTDHQVKYELKPDVRKAGGVYYTPEYIVDYIVKNTVGKLLKELPANRFLSFRTKRGISSKTKKLRILDPACGSGSFLIRAYEEMLNYYKNQKKVKSHAELVSASHKKGIGAIHRTKRVHPQQLIEHEEQEPTLTIEEKSQILREHIFGVDIDEQAVEVTKLSLMLKMLEGEFGIIPGRNILPMLDKNIRCGNSLISGDTLELKKYFGDDWYKVKAFNWKDAFRKIMVDEGGFDVVIGNPPYIQIQKLNEYYPKECNFYRKNYGTACKKNVDIYVAFIEQSLSSLVKKKGVMGFICPNRFFNSDYGINLRKYIENYNIYHLVNFRHYLVFENSVTYTCLLHVQNIPQQKILIYKEIRNLYSDKDGLVSYLLNKAYKSEKHFVIDKIKPHFLNQNKWYFMTEGENQIFEKIARYPKFREFYKEFFVGIQTSLDKVYILKYLDETKTYFKLYSRILNREVLLEKGIMKPILDNTNIDLYFVKPPVNYVIFPYLIKSGIASLLTKKDLELKYPKTWNYLNENKKVLENRERGKFKIKKWYKFGRNQNIAKQSYKKLLIPHVVKNTIAAVDSIGEFCLDNVGVNGIVLKDKIMEHPHYFLGLLNSPIASFFISKTSIYLSGGFYATNKQFASEIPVKRIDFSNSVIKKLHDNLVALVDVMLDLNKKTQTAKGSRKDQIQRQIKKTDREIDEIVYKLYGITEEERKVIEGKQV